jgi:hypothetical protein
MRKPLLRIAVGVVTTAMMVAAHEPHDAAAGLCDSRNAESPGGCAPEKSIAGTVVETMDAGTYTYVRVQVDDSDEQIWAAAPKFAVAVGDEVVVPGGSPMRNFHSKTLDRTFDLVYFVGSIQAAGGHTSDERLAAAHSKSAATAAATTLDFSGIEKAPDGHTVAEVFANKVSLADTEVLVRGRVTKFAANIMKTNWVHVQDGTGAEGANDLTVTTRAKVAVGDTVLVRGKLSTDKNFGHGYEYSVIIEDAHVSVE